MRELWNSLETAKCATRLSVAAGLHGKACQFAWSICRGKRAAKMHEMPERRTCHPLADRRLASVQMLPARILGLHLHSVGRFPQQPVQS